MRKHIIILGAGKSSTCLINYLLADCAEHDWQLTIADSDLSLAQSKAGTSTRTQVQCIDIQDAAQRTVIIQQADIVVSLLPPPLQLPVVEDCIRYQKHLLTASYMDEQTKALADEISRSGILVLCEMGLDPGIDHMSAMKRIDTIKSQGGVITSFVSHCGGLISHESDDNPWHYKISWNPRNIIMAGSAGAAYLLNDEVKEASYQTLFGNCREVEIPGAGRLAYYPNRDSLQYLSTYQLEGIHTFMRTTLRHPAYCKAWHAIVQAGLTSSVPLQVKQTTLATWAGNIHPFVNEHNKEQLHYLGLFDQHPVPPHLHTSADILQYLFETKLHMKEHDKDIIVMLHQIGYEVDHRKKLIESSLIVHGKNKLETAMAKTVGLPLGIAVKLILQNTLILRGLHIPVLQEVYEPVLRELELHGIGFRDEEKLLAFSL